MAIVTTTKNHEQGLKATIARKFNKAKAANVAATVAATTAVAQIMPVLCDNSAVATAVGSLLDTIVFPIMWGVGVLLFVVAAGNFISAFVDENNTNGMTKAAKWLFAAIGLTILRELMKAWLASNGVTIS